MVLLKLMFLFNEFYHLSDEVTRDFAYGETDSLVRRCRLLPWLPDELEAVSDDVQEPSDLYYEVSELNYS